MPVRRLTYPNYSADAPIVMDGDVRLLFAAPGSTFGTVEIILAAQDAEALLSQLAKALDKSDERLAAPGSGTAAE